jgi:hypothetical protein
VRADRFRTAGEVVGAAAGILLLAIILALVLSALSGCRAEVQTLPQEREEPSPMRVGTLESLGEWPKGFGTSRVRFGRLSLDGTDYLIVQDYSGVTVVELHPKRLPVQRVPERGER